MQNVCVVAEMGWKATGRPTVQRHRDRWVVRVDGVDTETGRRRPRQLGTYPSQRAARNAAADAIAEGRQRTSRQTLADLVDRWVASRTDIGIKQREQYEWAATHIKAGLGGVAVHDLDSDDIVDWIDSLASGGELGRRSIQIVRMTLRAALAAAVKNGALNRNPAASVPMPRQVERLVREKEAEAWDDDQLDRFLSVCRNHRWGGPMRLEVLYGLRRSELLALVWSSLDLEAGSVTIKAGLIEAQAGLYSSDGKNRRSRRTIPLDEETTEAMVTHRRLQDEERQRALELWQDNGLVVATHIGGRVRPRNYNTTLDRLVARAGVPRLTTHGLRHTAATHMVATAADLGEVRAAADVLGHSPEMLMKTYAHVLPASTRAIVARVGERSSRTRHSTT
jgi:integrase